MYGQTNAQGGGTLLENRVSALELRELIAVPVSGDITNIGAGMGGSINFPTSDIPSGYTMIGISVWQTNGWDLISVNGELNGGSPVARVWNGRTSAVSVHVDGLLFCKRT